MAGSAVTFPNFCKLSVEDRKRIWGYVAMQPRNISIMMYQLRRRVPGEKSKAGGRHAPRYKPTVPSILKVNKESRAIGLEHYKLCLRLADINRTSSGFGVYINFMVDTVLIQRFQFAAVERKIHEANPKDLLATSMYIAQRISEILTDLHAKGSERTVQIRKSNFYFFETWERIKSGHKAGVVSLENLKCITRDLDVSDEAATVLWMEYYLLQCCSVYIELVM